MPGLYRRIKAYFVVLNFVILLLVSTLMAYTFWQPRADIVEATIKEGLNQQEIAGLLFDEEKAESTDSGPKAAGRPAIVLIAASGGGSRAALYTSSALEGLQRIDALKKVKLVSGVSGGGVALAYLKAHRDALLKAKPSDAPLPKNKRTPGGDPWADFQDAMAHHYIEDVLRAGMEWRILWKGSFATLLPRSFESQFWPNATKEDVTRIGQKRNGQDKTELGLILNTTLVGQNPPEFALVDGSGNPFTVSGKQIQSPWYASGIQAGSRLIFTNLECTDAFPGNAKEYGSRKNDFLRYIVVNDDNVPLAKAASLNANFPPVFRYAPVEVKGNDASKKTVSRRYWLTDGGAEENKGEVSLLYALRWAIQQQAGRATQSVLPDIHVVVLEASGGSVRYRQDFGDSITKSCRRSPINPTRTGIALMRSCNGSIRIRLSRSTLLCGTHYVPT